MSFLITAGEAEPVTEGVWRIDLPPHQVRLFGDCRRTEGEQSVLLVSAAAFDADAKTLTFDAGTATPLNVGRSSSAIIICGEQAQSTREKKTLENTKPGVPASTVSSSSHYGPGDREFLMVAEQLPRSSREAARNLLAEVRKRSPGDLKRGEQRNFSNTPDNFWYVIVQPRVGTLSVTVRGEPSRFGQQRLGLIKDRPGYTRFKVSCPEDVADAVEIIFASKMRL